MTPEFLKWLANRWPADSAHGNRHWERLRSAITTRLTPDQALIWAATLVDLVADRWAALAPPGLATARAAITFLQIERSERARRWVAPAMGVSSVEHYLRVAIGEIIEREQLIACDRAGAAHPLNADVRQRANFVTACRDEVVGVIVAIVIQAYERAIAPIAAQEQR